MPPEYTAGGISGSGIKVLNTIVAGNTGGDINGTFHSASQNNLIGNGAEGNLSNGLNGNQVGTTASPINAGLSTLGNYGGPTQTHALLAGSPAINAGSNAAVDWALLTMDQRGSNRNVNNVDIGAFELAADEYFGSI